MKLHFDFTIIFVGFIIFPSLYSAQETGNEYFTSQPQKNKPFLVRERDTNTVLPCVVNLKYAQEPYTLNWIQILNGSPRILTTGQNNRASEAYDLDVGSCTGCYNLRIKSVTYKRDNGKFFCNINGQNVDINSEAADVVVLVKPGAPLISSQPVNPLREGTSGNVRCESVGGNPPPKFRWYFSNGTEITQFAQQTNATDLTSPSRSTLQWTVNANENGARLVCKVWNEAMDDNATPLETTTTPLSVLYPPRVFVGPVPVYNVELGAAAGLYCAADANPPVTRYVWQFNGNTLSTGTNYTIQTTLKSSSGNYTCTATNEDNNSGHDTVMLIVQYAPEITTSSEYRGAVGRKATLVCTVDANPAPTSISWTGPNGKSSDGAVMEIGDVSLKDMGNYTCTAKNMLNLYASGTAARSSTKTTTLIVDHPPGRAIINTPLPVIAGSVANLSCTADDLGSPSAQFKWKAPGQQDFEHASRNTYTIYDVQMAHAGVYSCLPWNTVGQGEVGTYKLIVSEPARLELLLKTEDSKNEGDTAYFLTCSAHGNPAPNITWYKDDERLDDDDHWAMTNRNELSTCDPPERCSSKVISVLQWKDGIRWSDKGVYACQAYNGAGRPTMSNMNMKVYHKPVVINDPKRPYVAADVGRQVEVECKASAKPEPTFYWFKNDKNISNDGSLYSIVNRRNESFDVFESTLVVKRVHENDMGDYSCKATNHLGENSFKFTLQPKTKPMIPENVRAVGQTHRSIVLSWTPGFDGGSAQTFTVEVVYPGGAPPRTFPAPDTSSRYKRHVGIEKANPVTLNVSMDISPINEYKFRVRSKNELGETEWTPYASVWTDDVPLNLSIPKPTHGIFNSDSLTLDFKPMNLDSQLYCLMIYRKENPNSKYTAYSCVDPTTKADGVPTSNNLKIRFCFRLTLTCGDDYEVMVGGLQANISWEIILAIVAAVVFVLVVPIVVCLCCRRCRFCKRFNKAAEKKKQLPKITGLRKDYEMETNNVRPKAISGPFLTEKTPGPSSGLSSLDQNTGSSKDSGVFTTGSNYQYDPNAYVDHETGRGVIRPPSYDEEHWGVTDGYGGAGYSHDYRDGGADGDVNRGYEPGGYYDPTSGYPDPYGHSVDMNPNPHMNTSSNRLHDGSLNSAYSTPSQRRVIREIIV